MRRRIVVVGAGLAGLTAANDLIDAGHEVTVLETRSAVAGRARTDEVDGFRLNLGPHALYRDGAGMVVLRSLGIDVSGWDVPASGGVCLDGGELRLLPAGPTSLLRTRLLSVRAKVEIGRLLGRLPGLDATAADDVPLASWVDDVVSDPGARRLLHALARLTTYADAPGLLSAGAVIAQLQGALAGGVRYLDGGWQRLATQLRDRAIDRGAVVRTGVAVSTVDRGERGLVVEADSPQLADGVVLALGPAAADRLLGGVGLAEAAGPAVTASVLDLGLRGLPPRRFVLGIDSPTYLSRHAPAADLAPEGHSLVTVAWYGDPGDTPPRDRRAELMALAHRSGIEAEQIVMDRYLHRTVVAAGLPLAERGGLGGRPAVAVPGHPGVVVAGDWVGDRGLLADAAFASGRAAAAAVVGTAAKSEAVA